MKRALLVALALAACGAPPKPPIAWTTTIHASNPLVGRTYDERKHTFVALEAARTPFVLLGEKHDNADHHRLQAEALHGTRGPVVFEMVDVDLQPAIDAYLAAGHATVDGLRDVLEWDRRGWPAWPLYRPIFDEIVHGSRKIVAAGLPHSVIVRLVHEGLASLPPEIAAHVHLHPLPPAAQASLDAEIKASHCGMLPDTLVPAMSLAQRVKDAFMADVMASQPMGAILIAGNGHVRNDRGVPFELAALRPGAPITTISFVEVDDSADPTTYAAEQPADFLVFTPRVDDEDPCAKFRAAR